MFPSVGSNCDRMPNVTMFESIGAVLILRTCDAVCGTDEGIAFSTSVAVSAGVRTLRLVG